MTRAIAVLIATLLGCSRAHQPESADDARAGDTLKEPVMPAGSVADTQPPAVEPGTPAGAAPGRPARSGPASAASPADAAGQERVLRGRIGTSGSAPAPVATLEVEGYGTLILRGPLESELRTLAGAIVAVRGVESGTRRRVLDIASYEILEIHGERPVTGTILPDGRLAAGRDTITLVGAPSEFRAGSRVWVVGDRSGSLLRVSSAGRIGTP